MGVYIPGMKMPKDCFECPMCYDAMLCAVIEVNFWHIPNISDFDPAERRLEDCPLIEVQPHGRLIDADRMLIEENVAYDTAQCILADNIITRSINEAVHKKIQMLINDSPTAIPEDWG